MAGLTSLESLNLANCHVNSAGIGALTGHGRTRDRALRVSTLAGHGPVPLGFGVQRCLRVERRFRVSRISRAARYPAGMAAAAGLRSLTSLNLRGCKVSKVAVANLKGPDAQS